MTEEDAAKLRAEFPPERIGKLPKPTRKDNTKGNCRECGGYHGLPAVHLDYVGHAATTDRLLSVDPAWTWKPMATDEQGFPVLDKSGGLWIELTVCGVTRPGYGDGSSTKEIIGDAIRNAAMRFGVALDLWAKEDISPVAEKPTPTPEQKARLDAALALGAAKVPERFTIEKVEEAARKKYEIALDDLDRDQYEAIVSTIEKAAKAAKAPDEAAA